MITLDQVERAQKKWGEGIIKIGSLKNNYKLCKQFTSNFLNERYNLKEGKILFSPKFRYGIVLFYRRRGFVL
jgi:hypothetical protein